jgi:hypothetical protein
VQAKYPEILKNINIEKATNSDLLNILKQVNEQYREKISLAAHQDVIDENTKAMNKAKARADFADLQLELYRQYQATGDVTYLNQYAANSRKWTFQNANVAAKVDWTDVAKYGQYEAFARIYKAESQAFHAQESGAQNTIQSQQAAMKAENYRNTVNDAAKIFNDKNLQKQVFGNDGKRLQQFKDLISKARTDKTGFGHSEGFANQLNALMHPEVAAAAPGGSTGNDGDGGGSDKKGRADGINQGGQRVVTINIGKQIEKMEVHVMGDKEAGQEVEDAVREALRRVVYSMNGVVS